MSLTFRLGYAIIVQCSFRKGKVMTLKMLFLLAVVAVGALTMWEYARWLIYVALAGLSLLGILIAFVAVLLVFGGLKVAKEERERDIARGLARE